MTVYNSKYCILPCFNQVATGTCAFGKYCLFLHDKRVFIHDKWERRQTESQLNEILRYYSPDFVNASPSSPSSNTDAESGSSSEDDSHKNYQMQPPRSKLAGRRIQYANHSPLGRDLFFYPSMIPTSLSCRNTGLYQPTSNQTNVEEISMWNHFLAMEAHNHIFPQKDFYHTDPETNLSTHKPRLATFRALAQGKTV